MLEIENLTFSYGERPLFRDFHFSSTSTYIQVRGPSGCGKTTLLKLLTQNLVPQKLTRISSFPTSALLLQEDALFPWLRGRENIQVVLPGCESSLEQHPLYPVIESFIDQYAYKMSYGQRRMVELFRVFLLAPKLLCLDEPFNFLDENNRNIFLNYLMDETSFPRPEVVVMSAHYTEDVGNNKLDVFKFAGTEPWNTLQCYPTQETT